MTGASISLGTPSPPTEEQIAAQKQAFTDEILGANPDIAAEEALASNPSNPNPDLAAALAVTNQLLNDVLSSENSFATNSPSSNSSFNAALTSATADIGSLYVSAGLAPQNISATVSGVLVQTAQQVCYDGLEAVTGAGGWQAERH
jgi:hypothetical protein